MTNNNYKTFAIVGVGRLGTAVADAFLVRNARIKILTRDTDKTDLKALEARGAQLVKIDYADQESLKAALVDVEVLVSTLSAHSVYLELELVTAAKAAGVQLFIPGEYGFTVTTGPDSIKEKILDQVKSNGLSYALFYCGFLADLIHLFLAYDFAQGHMRVVGDGDLPFSATSIRDVGRFVAHVLTTASKEQLNGAVFTFEAERYTPMEIAALAEKKYGKPMEIRRVDRETNVMDPMVDFTAFLGGIIADGRALVGTKDEVMAVVDEFYPDWNPSPIVDVI